MPKKTGSKILVNVEVLKAFGAEIEKLPQKEKISYDIKEAVIFLRPFLNLAIEKNYTKDEIFALMEKVGWNISQNSFKYFWSLFLSEEEKSGKKKNHSQKSLKKIKNKASNTKEAQNERKLSYDFSITENEIITTENETQNQISDTHEQNLDIEKTNFQQENKHESIWNSSAYFTVRPDTKDL